LKGRRHLTPSGVAAGAQLMIAVISPPAANWQRAMLLL